MLNFYNFLHINNNRPFVNKFTLLLTTLITLCAFNSSALTKAQSLTANNSKIVFYGSDTEANSMGAEYILFQDNDNHSARGLVYVQNSDAFSCFQADFDRQNQSFDKVIFAYPEMVTEQWIKNESEEKISLGQFPIQLNYEDANENAKELLNQCLKYFEHN